MGSDLGCKIQHEKLCKTRLRHTLTITALGRLRQDNVEFETNFGCLPEFVFNPTGSCEGLVGEAMDKRA